MFHLKRVRNPGEQEGYPVSKPRHWQETHFVSNFSIDLLLDVITGKRYLDVGIFLLDLLDESKGWVFMDNLLADLELQGSKEDLELGGRFIAELISNQVIQQRNLKRQWVYCDVFFERTAFVGRHLDFEGEDCLSKLLDLHLDVPIKGLLGGKLLQLHGLCLLKRLKLHILIGLQLQSHVFQQKLSHIQQLQVKSDGPVDRVGWIPHINLNKVCDPRDQPSFLELEVPLSGFVFVDVG